MTNTYRKFMNKTTWQTKPIKWNAGNKSCVTPTIRQKEKITANKLISNEKKQRKKDVSKLIR